MATESLLQSDGAVMTRDLNSVGQRVVLGNDEVVTPAIAKREGFALGPIASRVGNTPLVHLSKFHPAVYAKLEYFNPTGSIKDRVALSLLLDAERKKKIVPGKSTIVDATSGNFGLALGVLGGERGYRVIMCIPENRSELKRLLMREYGISVVLTPAVDFMRGSIEAAKEMAAQWDDHFYTDQFGSPLNVKTHESTTGPEIWNDMHGEIDAVVIVAGSGATFCGVTRALQARNPRIRAYLAQPEGSVFARPGKTPAPWKVEGVGSTFEPPVFDRSMVKEEPIDVPDAITIETQQELFSAYPYLSHSPCSALAAYAAREVARKNPQFRRVVTVFTEEVTRSVARIPAPLALETLGSAQSLPSALMSINESAN